MKLNQRFLSLVIIILLALLPASAFASNASSIASNKVETLNFGQWYELKEDDEVYKVNIKADTVIIADWKNQKGEGFVSIYPDRDCNEDRIYSLLDSDDATSGSDGVVLYSGIYYIKMGDWDEKASVRFTQRTANTINKPNYCKNKAITMKKNKKYMVSQTKKENYKRWYKIKLTGSQIISITGYGYNSYALYDKNLNRINCKVNEKTATISTRGKQPSGTYYFVINEEDLEDILDKGWFYTLSWK